MGKHKGKSHLCLRKTGGHSCLKVKVGKTHDIATLLELCLKKDRDFQSVDIEKLEQLTFYAVEVRYPEEFYAPSMDEARSIQSSRKSMDIYCQKIGIYNWKG